jgi:hypothetical protein
MAAVNCSVAWYFFSASSVICEHENKKLRSEKYLRNSRGFCESKTGAIRSLRAGINGGGGGGFEMWSLGCGEGVGSGSLAGGDSIVAVVERLVVGGNGPESMIETPRGGLQNDAHTACLRARANKITTKLNTPKAVKL